MACKPLFSNFSCNFRQVEERHRFQEGGSDEMDEEDDLNSPRPSVMKFLEISDS